MSSVKAHLPMVFRCARFHRTLAADSGVREMFNLGRHLILSGVELRLTEPLFAEAVSPTDDGFVFIMMVVSRFAGRA